MIAGTENRTAPVALDPVGTQPFSFFFFFSPERINGIVALIVAIGSAMLATAGTQPVYETWFSGAFSLGVPLLAEPSSGERTNFRSPKSARPWSRRDRRRA